MINQVFSTIWSFAETKPFATMVATLLLGGSLNLTPFYATYDHLKDNYIHKEEFKKQQQDFNEVKSNQIEMKNTLEIYTRTNDIIINTVLGDKVKKAMKERDEELKKVNKWQN